MEQEPINALVMDKEKPPDPACSCETFKELVAYILQRLDFIEHELALKQGNEDRRGLVSEIRRKLALD